MSLYDLQRQFDAEAERKRVAAFRAIIRRERFAMPFAVLGFAGLFLGAALMVPA